MSSLMDSVGLLGRCLLGRLMGLMSLPHLRSMLHLLHEAAGSLCHIAHDVLEARRICAQEVSEVVEKIRWLCGPCCSSPGLRGLAGPLLGLGMSCLVSGAMGCMGTSMVHVGEKLLKGSRCISKEVVGIQVSEGRFRRSCIGISC